MELLKKFYQKKERLTQLYALYNSKSVLLTAAIECKKMSLIGDYLEQMGLIYQQFNSLSLEIEDVCREIRFLPTYNTLEWFDKQMVYNKQRKAVHYNFKDVKKRIALLPDYLPRLMNSY